MIFKYDITVPLTYNKYEILSNNPDSEICFEIDRVCEEKCDIVLKTYEIPGYDEGYDFKDIMKINLYDAVLDVNKTGNNKQKIDNRLMCEIDGILADDEKYARRLFECIIDKICRRLSLVFVKHNSNRYLYQPRVEPLWSETIFNREEYAPFVDLKRRTFEKTDGINKTIHLIDHIQNCESLYRISRIEISSDEIQIGEWISEKDEVVEFLINEYYSALGTENIKSKFFHLFAIIEFCEMKYEKYNGSYRLLSDEEVNSIIVSVEEQIDAKKKDKVISVLKNNLIKVNNLGRIKKLENILKWMGIEKYGKFEMVKPIDKKILSDITELRNKSFHGTIENIENAETKYLEAVEVLLGIDEQILDFVMKKSYQN